MRAHRLSHTRIPSVRPKLTARTLQIGFYHLCGVDPSVLSGTDFAGLDDVFAGAWSRITNAIATAYRHGLGVFIGA